MKALLLILALSFGFGVWAEPVCTVQTDMTDVIGPATVDLVKRVKDFAQARQCSSIFYQINTPGGSLASTRKIVEMILNSPIPVLCLVAPSGGHAGSAGAIILQACHVNGALRGTNLGAATPIGLGKELPKDLRQKILNDTSSWLDSLTKLRGRSEKFGRQIILDAKAVDAEEAVKIKATDFVGDTPDEFLKFAEGRKVKMSEKQETEVKVGAPVMFAHDTRYETLLLLTDPELAYMMLLGSLALLYFEFTHTGVLLPGIIGGVGLVISFVALERLDVEWGGVLLIMLGIGLLILEMFLPTFGLAGVGGIASFVLGSVFLFDPVKSWGYRLPLTLIIPVVLISAGVFVSVTYLMLNTRRVKKRGGFDDMMGLTARVIGLEGADALKGQIELRGEIWHFVSDQAVAVQDPVVVKGHKGLVLLVEKEVK
jgi:membrane-bound serine protease (ClpP class)